MYQYLVKSPYAWLTASHLQCDYPVALLRFLKSPGRFKGGYQQICIIGSDVLWSYWQCFTDFGQVQIRLVFWPVKQPYTMVTKSDIGTFASGTFAKPSWNMKLASPYSLAAEGRMRCSKISWKTAGLDLGFWTNTRKWHFITDWNFTLDLKQVGLSTSLSLWAQGSWIKNEM